LIDLALSTKRSYFDAAEDHCDPNWLIPIVIAGCCERLEAAD
jgi:hypothetical protein